MARTLIILGAVEAIAAGSKLEAESNTPET
jgi:hypothetical protein